VIVAWSYGTLVIMDYVRHFGTAELAGVTLTGALGALLPFRTAAGDDAGMAEFARIRQLQVGPNLADQVAAARLVVPMLTAAPMPDAERSTFEAIALMLPAYARRAMTSRQQDNQDLLEALSATPLLLALGAEDNQAMLEDGVEMAAAKGNIEASVYQGAGHSVFLENPERFNAELRQFARKSHQGIEPQ
jgi:non-heme chloroperoxidase